MKSILLYLLIISYVSASLQNEPDWLTEYFDEQLEWLSREDNTKIIGGTNATVGEYPYHVWLGVISYHFYACGGSIIGERWVLTAAHCTFPENNQTIVKERMDVVVGTVNVSAYHGERYKIETIYRHPDYNATDNNSPNDIALLKLTRNIQFSHKVQPIRLARNEPAVGSLATATGWGYYSNNNQTGAAETLQQIELRTISNARCAHFYGNTIPGTLCTLTRAGQGVCQGDSGGPLVLLHNSTASRTLVGIVKAGLYRPECASGYPDVFTIVANYLSWIHNVTGIL